MGGRLKQILRFAGLVAAYLLGHVWPGTTSFESLWNDACKMLVPNWCSRAHHIGSGLLRPTARQQRPGSR
jgi:hypothetical protein